jgi:putative hydrolase of HD superfamily
VADATRALPFGPRLEALIVEYRDGQSLEAMLARDADQIALILELKNLKDIGYEPPNDWLPHVLTRLQTETGKALAAAVMATRRDSWWWEAAVSTHRG